MRLRSIYVSTRLFACLVLLFSIFAITPDQSAYAITNSDAIEISWNISPVWTGAQTGPSDAGGFFWHQPAFDASAWQAVALPVNDSSTVVPSDRYFRGQFQWDGSSNLLISFNSDDGLAIYINGNRLGEWGGGWRTIGCVNCTDGSCKISTSVPPQTIPTSWLNKGDNLIAIDLWDAGLSDFTLGVQLESVPPPVSQDALVFLPVILK